ncbi:DUF1254 domain-containing protein [Shimia sp. R11_0]|uniref:DUF1214 domain-containing protein n=1 Tax=Shimia sp. R11_0 TaxID=2821096 RepID=UPI001ADBE04F|nr:DUF1214 domain-containing protein [Shimia sp. R11_0]MBO9477016.1 DUF1254 domain-containing protein [Shimia sp. R11_0]
MSRRAFHALAASGLALGLSHRAHAQTADSSAPQTSLPADGQGKEPRGGQPPAGVSASVGDFGYQLAYQRAFELLLWAMPAQAIYRFRAAALEDLGLRDNDILAWSAAAPPNLEATTANSSTPYITAFSDLQAGPLVLEVPTAGPEGSLYGQVVDAWQYTIADVGPSGMDQGKGAKYLFTPPGYEGDAPEGYIHVPSPNYRIAFAFRSVRAEGKTTEDAYAYAKKLRMYPLAQAQNPPKQRFFDPIESGYQTLPFFDERAFEDMYHVFTVEPPEDKHKVMLGMMETLGIKRGRPYAPNDTAKKAMRQAAIDVWYAMEAWFDAIPKEKLYWPDRHYASLLLTDENKRFTWEYDDRIDTYERAAEYFWCTYMPTELSDAPATQYMMGLADNTGAPLMAGATYRLDLPADMPVSQFWALTVYDRATKSFIYTEEGRTTLSSYDIPNMVKNDDGGVSLFVGPAAPEGMQSNWIPTRGKRPLTALRLYGPTEDFNQKRFKLADFVRIS